MKSQIPGLGLPVGAAIGGSSANGVFRQARRPNAGGSHAGAVRRHEITVRGVDGVPVEGVGAVGDLLQVTTTDPSNHDPNAISAGDLWIHASNDYQSPHAGFALKDSTVSVIGDTLPGPGPGGTAQWVNVQTQAGVQGWADLAYLTAASAVVVPPPPAVVPVAPPMPIVPPAPPGPLSSPYAKPILIGAGILGVAALGFIVYKTKGKKGGLRRRVSHLRRRHA
jgi:hypothetical protein